MICLASGRTCVWTWWGRLIADSAARAIAADSFASFFALCFQVLSELGLSSFHLLAKLLAVPLGSLSGFMLLATASALCRAAREA